MRLPLELIILKMPPMRRTGYSKVSLANAKKARRAKKTRKFDQKTKRNSSDMMIYKSIAKELVKNQLHVFRYPFSTRTKYPKIPDGIVNDSVGLSFAYSEKVTFNPAYDCFVVLYPGHTTCCAVFQVINQQVEILSYGKFIQHMIPRYEADQDRRILDFSETGFSGYRYVSCGLRITSDEGDFINNGTWEATRFATNNVGRDFVYVYNQAEVTWNALLPSNYLVNRVNGDLTLNPSFQHGVMKTIDDYEFRLRPVKLEHEVVNLPKIVELEDGDFDQNYMDRDDGFDNQHLFKSFLDPAYDTIVVKINTSIGGTQRLANITYNVIANIECIPDSGSKFAHFSTAGLRAPGKFYKTQKDLQRDSRYAGTYNFNKRYQKHM